MRRAFEHCCRIFVRRTLVNAGRLSKRCRRCPRRLAPFMATLLADTDADVRILATELARNMPAEDATRVLCRLAGE